MCGRELVIVERYRSRMYLHRSSTEKHFYDVGIHTTFYPAEEDQSNVDVSATNPQQTYFTMHI